MLPCSRPFRLIVVGIERRISPGAVNHPPVVLLWSTGAIWANSGDKAVQYENAGTTIDSWVFNSHMSEVALSRWMHVLAGEARHGLR
jgi:hypothetical protein